MTEPRTCPQCGARVSERRVEGLCPGCLAKHSLQIPTTRAQVLGDYELLGEISRGGMGVVYKARQRSLQRLVALKMILAGHFARAQDVQRFKAEALAAANLQHPNIVAIHEVGQWEGHHFFSMDYVEGPTLAELVAKQPLPAEQAARYVRTIAEAVHYAHEHGVLHRDLKPSNILIDGDKQPRISDFGLAKLAQANSDLTLSGKAIGSPSYMPPEQSVGRRSAIGPHSDVYSLGAMLYHLVTGRPPFAAETVQATLMQVLEHEPVPPRALNPGVPRDLETVCLKCLEKDPRRRYSTARELADELGRFLEQRPIEASPINVIGRSWRWCRRNPELASWVSAAVMLLMLGFAGVLWQWQRAERHAQSESIERTRAEHTLTQLELQRVEDLLRENDSAKALAHLAFALRNNPSNLAVAERIMSVLTHRNFALPLTPPITTPTRMNDADFSADGKWAATASDDGMAQIWDATSGRPVISVGHSGQVRNINFSFDSQWFSTVSSDNIARVWNVSTGAPVTPPLLHTGTLAVAYFSPDNEWLITGGDDGWARLWKLPGGKAGFVWPHEKDIIRPRFSPNGGLLVTTPARGSINVWDCNTGELLHTFRMEARILDADITSNDERLAAAGENGVVKLWNLGNGELIASLRHRSVARNVAFSPDSELLATVTSDRRALLWDGRTGELALELPQHLTQINQVRFSPDGLRLLTFEMSNRILIWDILSGQPTCEPIHLRSRVKMAEFHQDGERLWTMADSGPVQLWDVRPGASVAMLLDHRESLLDAQFSPSGRSVFTVASSGSASLWDLHTGQRLLRLAHGTPVVAAQWTSDHRRFATAGSDRKVRVWDPYTSNVVTTLQHEGDITSVQFSHDGKWLVTASRDRTAQSWVVDTGHRLAPQPMRHSNFLYHAAFSRDGKLVVTSSHDGTARIWKTQTGEPATDPLGHARAVLHAEFSPNGRKIVTASLDMSATVWDVTTGQPVVKLLHAAPVRDAQFSADSKRIVTASGDNTARIWDAETGVPLTGPVRHGAEVGHVEFSADARRILTASAEGTARLWDALTGRPLGEPLPHYKGVRQAHISANQQWLITAAPQGHLWEIPLAPAPAPRWLGNLAEAVAGLRLTDDGFEEITDDRELFELKRQLQAGTVPVQDSYGHWLRWFFADRSLRGISPSSSVHHQEMRRHFAQENSLKGGREQLRLSPTNAEAWSRLASMVLSQEVFTNPHKTVQADIFSRRAVALSPENPDLLFVRVNVLMARNKPEEADALLHRAIQRQPTNPELWYLQGQLLAQRQAWEEAVSAFAQAAAHSPRRNGTRYQRALREIHRALFQLKPHDEATREWLSVLKTPERGLRTSSQYIDLSPYYNAALSDDWHGHFWTGNNLATLPTGVQHFDGTTFDVRGIVQLASTALDMAQPGFPEALRGIKVQQRCDRLHFLHATGWGLFAPQGTKIGTYLVRYADGTLVEIPLINGEDLAEWQVSDPASELPRASVAWVGTNARKLRVQLFRRTWDNPYPGISIESIDFLSTMTAAAPFLIAVTAE
jgi:eukaryotic-like serine/threonine-protein kinase